MREQLHEMLESNEIAIEEVQKLSKQLDQLIVQFMKSDL